MRKIGARPLMHCEEFITELAERLKSTQPYNPEGWAAGDNQDFFFSIMNCADMLRYVFAIRCHDEFGDNCQDLTYDDLILVKTNIEQVHVMLMKLCELKMEEEDKLKAAKEGA